MFFIAKFAYLSGYEFVATCQVYGCKNKSEFLAKSTYTQQKRRCTTHVVDLVKSEINSLRSQISSDKEGLGKAKEKLAQTATEAQCFSHVEDPSGKKNQWGYVNRIGIPNPQHLKKCYCVTSFAYRKTRLKKLETRFTKMGDCVRSLEDLMKSNPELALILLEQE